MKQNIYHYGGIILVWAVIALGMVVRIQNGDYFPIYQNDDSPFYVWLGNSIYDDFKHPSSLTIFEGDNPALFWRSQYRDLVPVDRFGFRMTDKYFDHPFLAALLMALPARFFGYTGFTQIPQMLVRAPALLAALATLGLTYWLGQFLFNQKVARLALSLLAVWPMAVFSQRQGYLENFITPVLLLGLGVLWRWRSHMTGLGFSLLSGCAVIAAWTKFAGYSLFGIFAYGLIKCKQKRWSGLILSVGVGSILLYLLYGQIVGGSHFWWTITHQQDRGAYLASIFSLFSSPQVQGGIKDGWWYIGLLSLGYLAVNPHLAQRLIGFSAFFWLLTTFFLSGPQNTSPWYIYPIYPLMMIGAAVMISEGLKQQPLVLEMMLAMLSLTGWQYLDKPWMSTLIRLGVIGVMSINALTWYIANINSKWVHQSIIGGLLLLALTGNILAIRKAPLAACGNYGCVKPEKIILQTP